MRTHRRFAWLLALGAIFPGSCGNSPPLRLLALSDEIALTCGSLGLRMVQGWTSTEEARHRSVSYEEADLGHLDGSRARCQGALRLLDKIAAEPRRVREPLASNLEDLVVLDRLLLESVVDPDMDRGAMAATVYGFGESYLLLRKEVGRDLPLSEAEQKRIVVGLRPRWDELTPQAVIPL
jgi:hypothetical protein